MFCENYTHVKAADKRKTSKTLANVGRKSGAIDTRGLLMVESLDILVGTCPLWTSAGFTQNLELLHKMLRFPFSSHSGREGVEVFLAATKNAAVVAEVKIVSTAKSRLLAVEHEHNIARYKSQSHAKGPVV